MDIFLNYSKNNCNVIVLFGSWFIEVFHAHFAKELNEQNRKIHFIDAGDLQIFLSSSTTKTHKFLFEIFGFETKFIKFAIIILEFSILRRVAKKCH